MVSKIVKVALMSFVILVCVTGCGSDKTTKSRPVITSFTATKNPITSGNSTTLTAVFTGGTGFVNNGIGAVTSTVAIATGNLTQTTTFTLTVTNEEGRVATLDLKVNVIPLPVIKSFSAVNKSLSAGGSTDLNFEFSGGVGVIDNGVGSVTSGTAVHIAPTTMTTYRLVVTNAVGDSVDLITTVDVAALLTPVALANAYYRSKVLLADGKVLFMGLDPQVYDPATKSFSLLNIAGKSSGYITRLNNGKVFILTGSSGILSVSLYDPVTGLISDTGTQINISVDNYPTVTLLQDGRVLVAGGRAYDISYEDRAAIYDPVTGSFTETGRMTSPRAYHSATLLQNGKVLINGGTRMRGGVPALGAELYDPVAGTFKAVGGSADTSGGATLLDNGKVLINQGFGQEFLLFDPVTETFTAAGHSDVVGKGLLLPNGKVLYQAQQDIGGITYYSLATYDPASKVTTFLGSLGTSADFPSDPTLLLDGTVLFTSPGVATAGIFTPQ